MDEFVEVTQEAPCQYFKRCGGCSSQHLKNDGEYKFLQVKQALADLAPPASSLTKAPKALEIGDLIKKTPEIPGRAASQLARDDEFFGILHSIVQIPIKSRRRVTFKINQHKICFNSWHSKDLISIAECLLLEDPINQLISPINKLIKSLKIRIDMISITNSDTGIELLLYAQERTDLATDLLITEFAKSNKVNRVAWQVKAKAPTSIIEFGPIQLQIGNILVDLPINSFLQVSKESSNLMATIILKHLTKAKKILELYCGCGSFTIPISSMGTITAIEGSSEAIEALNKATKSFLLPIKTIKQDLYQNPYTASNINEYSQVVINPPRNGATPQIREISRANGVKKVILISCSLENFIRDARILLRSGFHLSDAYPIDQFRYSNHLEIIGIFER